jgi:hypothetical protein
MRAMEVSLIQWLMAVDGQLIHPISASIQALDYWALDMFSKNRIHYY